MAEVLPIKEFAKKLELETGKSAGVTLEALELRGDTHMKLITILNEATLENGTKVVNFEFNGKDYEYMISQPKAGTPQHFMHQTHQAAMEQIADAA